MKTLFLSLATILFCQTSYAVSCHVKCANNGHRILKYMKFTPGQGPTGRQTEQEDFYDECDYIAMRTPISHGVTEVYEDAVILFAQPTGNNTTGSCYPKFNEHLICARSEEVTARGYGVDSNFTEARKKARLNCSNKFPATSCNVKGLWHAGVPKVMIQYSEMNCR